MDTVVIFDGFVDWMMYYGTVKYAALARFAEVHELNPNFSHCTVYVRRLVPVIAHIRTHFVEST
jgi:hypothetical protein